MATTIHLIRHGSYDAMGRVLAGRSEGWPINAGGRAEADSVARRLAGTPLRMVVSSTIERARQTAAPIAAAQGLAVAVHPGLDEIDFGSWTGMSFDELHADPRWQIWNRHRGLAPIPGGETMVAVLARALAVLGDLRRAWPDGDVALVSHADVIRVLLGHLLGSPLDLFHRLTVDPASRSEIRLWDDGVQVVAVNLPPGV